MVPVKLVLLTSEQPEARYVDMPAVPRKGEGVIVPDGHPRASVPLAVTDVTYMHETGKWIVQVTATEDPD
jgi:hypothetical protein